jgi:hypothetical protein
MSKIDYSLSALPKPTPRVLVKGRSDRAEAKVKKAVRAACVARDGHCLVGTRVLGVSAECRGESEWAHLAGHRRSQTRGLPPERRHQSRFTAMLCTRHHDQEEHKGWRVVYRTAEYADGPVGWERSAVPTGER